jgi:hypothetical protein
MKQLVIPWYDVSCQIKLNSFAQHLVIQEKGVAPSSFVAEALERNRDSPDFELQAQHVKEIACQIFGGDLLLLNNRGVLQLTINGSSDVRNHNWSRNNVHPRDANAAGCSKTGPARGRFRCRV